MSRRWRRITQIFFTSAMICGICGKNFNVFCCDGMLELLYFAAIDRV